MVKPQKQFRKEVAKTEVARLSPETAKDFITIAHAYRNQADILKRKRR